MGSEMCIRDSRLVEGVDWEAVIADESINRGSGVAHPQKQEKEEGENE